MTEAALVTHDLQEYFPSSLINKSLVLFDKDNTGYFYLPGIEILRYMGYNYKENFFWFVTEISEVQFSMECAEENELASYYKQHDFENPFKMGVGLLELIDSQCAEINKDIDYYLSYFNKPRNLIEDYCTHSEKFLTRLQQHVEANKRLYLVQEEPKVEAEAEIEGDL